MAETSRKSSKRRKILLISSVTLFVVLSLFIYFKYYFVYSEGTRVGILYKFSKKGTIFKTYEGEMVLPGIRSTGSISSNMFYFSVSDEELAKTLMKSQGMELELSYEYFNGRLPWRGKRYEGEDGQYVVSGLVRVKNENPNGYGL